MRPVPVEPSLVDAAGLRSAVFAAMSEAVLVTDRSGVVIDANPAAESMFGYSRQQLVGVVPGALNDPERATRRFAAVLAALESGEQWTAEVPFRRGGDGQRRLSRTTVVALRGDDGEVIGTVDLNRDVTDERRAEVSLHELEERWRLTLDGAATGIALVALDGRFVRVNDALCRTLGRAADDLLRLRFQDVTHGDDLAKDLDQLAQLVDGRLDRYTIDKRYLRGDGELVWATVSVALISDPTTLEPLHFVSHITDVTDRVRAAEAARAAAERQTAVVAAQLAIADADLAPQKVMHAICGHAQELTGADGAVIELDEGTDVVYRAVTGGALPFLGMRVPVEGSLSGLALKEGHALRCDDAAVDPRVDGAACARVGLASMVVVPLRQRGRNLGVLKVLSRRSHRFSDDDLATLELLAAPFGSALGNATRLEETTHRATTDAVTGLANRSYALTELDRALERQARRGGHTAVIFCDLDRFKAVNDRFGHSAGDELLVQVADRLKQAVRTTDTPARFGGDEFLVVCDGLSAPEDAQVLADRLLADVVAPYRLDLGPARIGASIGVAVATTQVGGGELLQAADEAMYQAKRSGGDRWAITRL